MKLNNLAHAWSDKVQEQKRMNLPTKTRFIFFHNPKNWELVTIPQSGKKKDRVLLLPQLSQLILQAGINGVRSNGRGVDPTMAIANLQSQGCTVLPPERHDYLVVFPVVGGKRFDSKFMEYEQIGTTVIKTFNHEKYNEFRIDLMKKGHIEPPHEHFVKLMIHANKPKINKYAKLLHEPSGKQKYDEALKYENDLKEASKQVKEKGVLAYE